MENRERLHLLMKHYRVSVKTVASLLNLTPETIRNYRSKSGVSITDNDLELLRYKLEDGFKIK